MEKHKYKDEASLDADIASTMGEMMLDHPKMGEQLQQALAQKNPEGALGMIAARTTLGVRDKMLEKGLVSNDKIWAANNGVLYDMVTNLTERVASEFGAEVDPSAIAKAAVLVMQEYDKSSEQSKMGAQPNSLIGGMAQPGQPAPQQAAPTMSPPNPNEGVM